MANIDPKYKTEVEECFKRQGLMRLINAELVQVGSGTCSIRAPYQQSLTQQMLPSLQAVAGKDKVVEIKAITGAEDFSFFQKEVPGLYFFLGGKPLDVAEEDAAPHHTPDFFIDESGMLLGVKAFVQLSMDYLGS